jgi:hypothetical protein
LSFLRHMDEKSVVSTIGARLLLALRIVVGSASFAGAITTLTLVKSSSAQNDTQVVSDPADTAAASQSDTQTPVDPAPAATADEDFAPNVSHSDLDNPVTDVTTGIPLQVFLTPFHWGHLSLISVTTSEGYNSNPEFQRNPLGSSVTSISASALYSTVFSGWTMNLQYSPFLWISSRETLKNFAAASADIRTLRHINDSWHWTLGDRLRYSPTHSTEEASGFVADPGGGFSIGNAFLSSGRNILVNGVAATLIDRYSENSTLTFHADQDYTRLSSVVGSGSTDSLPSEQAVTFAAGGTWRDRVGLQDTLSVEYTIRAQTSTGSAVGGVDSNAASAGWSHKFSQTLGVSASFGPAWSTYGGREDGDHSSSVRATLHGSLALSKEFSHGGVVMAFARSDSFTGIISNSFHNRYDIAAHREFNSRLNCSATASYIQQEITNQRGTQGKLASAEVRYFLDRNWAIFTQLRYLDITGNERIFAPEKSAVLGFRWFWVPEKP